MSYMTTKTEAPATAKQIAFLKRLCAERPMWRLVENLHDDVIDRMGKRVISQFIDEALHTPKEEQPAQTERPEPPAMIHFRDGHIYRVVRGKQGGRLYVKELHFDVVTNARWWEYLGRAPLVQLSEDTVMTLEQMRNHGHHTGFCIKCDAELSDPTSVEQGMGPVCIKRASDELRKLGKLS